MTQPTLCAVALAVPLLLHDLLPAQQAPDNHTPMAAAQTAFAALQTEDIAATPLAIVAPNHRDRTVAYERAGVTETRDERNDGLK
jgi:hypothetical protein